MNESQSNERVPSVPAPLKISTPTSELNLNPLEITPSNSGSTKPRSDSLSVLKSSRPAPPSPASSRPGSQQFLHSPILTPSSPRDRSGSSSSSRMGSSMQRKVSGASSRQSDRDWDGGKPSRRKSTLGQNFSLPQDDRVDDGIPPSSTGNSTPRDTPLSSTPIPEDTPVAASTSTSTSTSSPTPKRLVDDHLEVKIRDYGFPSTDERFFGRGQPAPKKRWRLSSFTLGGRRPSGTASGEGSPRSPDPSEEDRKTWGFGLFGWRGFGRKRSMSSESASASEGRAISDEPEDTDDVVEEDYLSDEQEEEEEVQGEEPSGTYRVAFSFVSEGVNEMGVDEGDIIQVTGRGGGHGWVVASIGGRSGLVPEGYLEKIADKEEDIEELQEEAAVEVAGKGEEAVAAGPVKE